MKTVVIVYEGAADAPRGELENRTPLQVARCPHAARLATEGRCGCIEQIRREADRRSEVLLGTLLGLPPAEAARLCRGPVEAAGRLAETEGYTHAFRGNFITLDDGQIQYPRAVRLSLEETDLLARVVEGACAPQGARVVTVAPGRVAVLLKLDDEDVAAGESLSHMESDAELHLPQGRKGQKIRAIFEQSGKALKSAPVNDVRVDLGENPATHLWLWGGGRFAKPSPVRGAVLSNSPLAAGLAHMCGMSHHALRGPWTDNENHVAANATAFAMLLEQHDFLLVYIEAPEEGGGFGEAVEKVRHLERLDQAFLGPALEAADGKASRILLTVDASEAPAPRRAPAVLRGAGIGPDAVRHFDEEACLSGALGTVPPDEVNGLLRGDMTWE
jgi:2,3-bisphosphoglycerate-independent phosphoglycerate mutase